MGKRKISKMHTKRKYQRDALTLTDQYEHEKNFFGMDIKNNGPQNQLVYILRSPISYKNFQSINQRVDFSSYFDWMGQVREYSLRPINHQISKLIQGGEWGLATNSVHLKIFDLLKADDVLEVRLWLDKVTGLDNIYHLSFDWLRFLDINSYERIALSNVVVSCVKIIGHGKAVITKPPKFLQSFFNSMKPKPVKKRRLHVYKNLFGNVDLGKKIKDFYKKPLFIFENFYQTFLEHSNLVGNIYFSNYSKWINSTKDLFLYQNNPKLFKKSRANEEFITLECSVSHLQEAMPFDNILVKMYLIELYEKGMALKYEVFKAQNNFNNIKLAILDQTIVFVGFDTSTPTIKRIPVGILDSFMKK